MPVELRVIPNKLVRDEYELNRLQVGITLDDWLRKNVPAYHPRPVPLFSVLLNGVELPESEWGETQFVDGDLLECFIEPKEPVTIALVVIAVVSAAAAIYYANQPIPDNYNSTVPTGSSIYDANAQGNRPKLMGVVPELFGTHKVFPDYIVPPRKEYIGNEEYFYALMCITRGYVSLSADNIFIGNTPITSFGSDVQASVFSPGQNVTGHDAHKVMYTSPEVGGLEIQGSKWHVHYDGSREYLGDSTWRLARGPHANTLSAVRSDGIGSRLDALNETGQDRYIEIYSGPDAILGFYKYNYDGSDNGRVFSYFEKVDANFQSTGESNPFSSLTPWERHAAKYRVISPGSEGYNLGPYESVGSGQKTEKLNFDFVFPEGLCRITDGGSVTTRAIEIRVVIDNVYPELEVVRYVFSAATTDELAYTRTITVPAGSKPIITVNRLTEDKEDLQYKDKCIWSAMRAEMPSPTSYSDVTTLAVKIKGSNALAGSSENKISCVPTRKLRHFNSSGVLEWGETNDLSAAVLEVWSNAGNPDSSIDMDELLRLQRIRDDEFNGVFDNATTVWEALKRILAVGFAVPTLDFGQLVPVIDEPRANLNYMYQPDNILENSWKMEATLIDESEPDGVEVEYFSSETWKPETILCTLPGEHGENPEKVRAYGVTKRDKAYQFGMRKRSELRYRRVRHTWSTEMDGMNSRYLSYDALGIDIPGFSQTGRVESVSGRTLTLDRDLEWGTGTHYMGLRKPDGLMSGPYVCTQGSDPDQVVLATSLDFAPKIDGTQEPPLFQFGVAGEFCEPVLVTDINPQGTERVQLKGTNYDARVFDYDDAQAPS